MRSHLPVSSRSVPTSESLSFPFPSVWEEVNGSHFYTLLSIYTGLKLGASLAARLDDLSAASRYIAEATKINAVISTFWSEHKQIIRVSKDHQKGRASIENAHFGDNTYGKTSELDAAVLLATLHAGHGTEWEHGNEKVLATLEALMDVMRFARNLLCYP